MNHILRFKAFVFTALEKNPGKFNFLTPDIPKVLYIHKIPWGIRGKTPYVILILSHFVSKKSSLKGSAEIVPPGSGQAPLLFVPYFRVAPSSPWSCLSSLFRPRSRISRRRRWPPGRSRSRGMEMPLIEFPAAFAAQAAVSQIYSRGGSKHFHSFVRKRPVKQGQTRNDCQVQAELYFY